MSHQEEINQEDFPSIFSSDHPLDFVSEDRLIDLHRKLSEELNDIETLTDDKLRVLNFLTYIYVQLCPDSYAAANCNFYAFLLSNKTNVTSVIYRCHLMTTQGKLDKAEECQKILLQYKTSGNYLWKLSEAKAELAYTYSRLGGLDNIRRAVRLYQEAVDNDGTNFTWKFGLGLACSHVVCWFTKASLIPVCERNKQMLSAVKHLMDTAEKAADDDLRSQSYSQLAVLKRFLSNSGLETEDCTRLFNGNSVRSLVTKALDLEPRNAKTLRDCGRLMKQFDVDKAIEVLEKSIIKVRHSQAFHNLGICYQIKASQKHSDNLETRIASNNNAHKEIIVQTYDQHCQTQNSVKKQDTISLNEKTMSTPLSPTKKHVIELDPISHHHKSSLSNELSQNQEVATAHDVDPGDIENVSNNHKQSSFYSGISNEKKKKKKKKSSFFMHCPVFVQQLGSHEEYVQKAEQNYQQAFSLSSKQNYHAMYALGLLYRSCGLTEKAKLQFKNIVEKFDSQDLTTLTDAMEFTTATFAHVQLGLCALGETQQHQDDNHKCKSELIKAMNILVSLKSSLPNTDRLLESQYDAMSFLLNMEMPDTETPTYLNIVRKFVTIMAKIIQRYELCIRKKSMLKTDN